MTDLGFGCMRLPLLNSDDPTSYNEEKIFKLFDSFIENGFTYFDTAYVYHGYTCEQFIKKALVSRYPRDKYKLATKLPLRDFKDEADLPNVFQEQLDNCGVEYFDYYLLHALGMNVYQKCVDNHAFEFVKKIKEEGKAINVGMSFHDSPELLEEILEKYGDCLDFIQLQINYIDFDQPNIRGRECLEICNKYNKPVTVMEPCKGGTLVNVPEEVNKLFLDYNPNASIASWAFRFAASQKGIVRVLSGMNDFDQLDDNMKTFKDIKPLNEEEMALINKAIEIINENTAIRCTGCSYCTKGCPMKIAIPQYFSLYNSINQKTGQFSSQQIYYRNLYLNGHGKASECIKCGACEAACPQHLPIRKYLEELVVEKLEKNLTMSVRK